MGRTAPMPPLSFTLRSFRAARAAAVSIRQSALTTDLDVQQMPSIAVDPTDSKHVVVAYMDYSLFDVADNPDTTDIDESYDHPYAGIGVAVSYDGGEHWEKTALTLPEEFEQGAANPIVKFDNGRSRSKSGRSAEPRLCQLHGRDVFGCPAADHQSEWPAGGHVHSVRSACRRTTASS